MTWLVSSTPATGIHARRSTKDKAERDSDLIELRTNCKEAMAILGVPPDNIYLGDFPDNEVDKHSLLELIQWVEKIINNKNLFKKILFPESIVIVNKSLKQAKTIMFQDLNKINLKDFIIVDFSITSNTESILKTASLNKGKLLMAGLPSFCEKSFDKGTKQIYQQGEAALALLGQLMTIQGGRCRCRCSGNSKVGCRDVSCEYSGETYANDHGQTRIGIRHIKTYRHDQCHCHRCRQPGSGTHENPKQHTQ